MLYVIVVLKILHGEAAGVGWLCGVQAIGGLPGIYVLTGPLAFALLSQRGARGDGTCGLSYHHYRRVTLWFRGTLYARSD